MKVAFYLLLFFLAGKSFGQPIELRNASFEGRERSETVPDDWFDCGEPNRTSPYLQPGSFDIDLSAADGNGYVVLVVRDDGSTGMIGQQLSGSLDAGGVYVLKLSVARSLRIMAPTPSPMERASYATPAMLRIWGGNGPCDKEELLATTNIIQNSDWIEIQMPLKPTIETTYILLEAHHKTPLLFPYNGNILIDNLSLTQIP